MKTTLALLCALAVVGSAIAQTPAVPSAPKPAPAVGPATTPTATPAAAPPAPVFAASNLTPLGVRSMAATCAACHGTNGNSVGGAIVALAGMNKEYFVTQMKLFKDGKREATLMHQLAKGYSDAETAAMADFFAAQKR